MKKYKSALELLRDGFAPCDEQTLYNMGQAEQTFPIYREGLTARQGVGVYRLYKIQTRAQLKAFESVLGVPLTSVEVELLRAQDLAGKLGGKRNYNDGVLDGVIGMAFSSMINSGTVYNGF